MVLFFFSGHGIIMQHPDTDEELVVLCPEDFDANDPDTYLTHEDVLSVVRKSPAKHKVCIFEACQKHGELAFMEDLERIIETRNYFDQVRLSIPENTIVITSCKKGEASREDGIKGPYFSHYLLEALDGKADGFGRGKKDGIITVGELMQYTQQQVPAYCRERKEPRQTPDIHPKNYSKDLPLFYLKN